MFGMIKKEPPEFNEYFLIQRKYGDSNENMGVSNKNLGVSIEIMGVSNKIPWVSNKTSLGVCNESGSPIVLQ